MDRASLSSALLDNRAVLIKITATAGVSGEFFAEPAEKLTGGLRFLPKYRDSSTNALSSGISLSVYKIAKCINNVQNPIGFFDCFCACFHVE
jgi:hypothetical protein